MKSTMKSMLQRPVLVGLVILGLCYAIRYAVIEPEAVRTLCLSTPQAWQCMVKMTFVHLFQFNRLGWCPLALGIAALITNRRPLAWAAWIVGLMGVVFYCYDMATVGALLGLVVLSQANPTRYQRG